MSSSVMDKSEPIFTIISDGDFFPLASIIIPEKREGTQPAPWKKRLSPLEMFRLFWDSAGQGQGSQPYGFYLSLLIITEANAGLQRSVARVSSSATRNIKFDIGNILSLFETGLKKTPQGVSLLPSQKELLSMLNKGKKAGKDSQVINRQLSEMLDGAFSRVKEQLGFPATDPTGYSYVVTDTVLATAKSEPCKNYLKKQRTQQLLFPRDLEGIEAELKAEFPDEADDIITVIRATQSREHVAALSLNTEGDQTFLSIANTHRQYVKMESWKFIAMVERDEEVLNLQELTKPKYGEPPSPFQFNNLKDGIVVGKLTIRESALEIACLDDKTNAVHCKAKFHLDSTYMLCIYTTLKRLQDDKIRFTVLMEQAKVLIALTKDPFNI
jgi:hypothetical protein